MALSPKQREVLGRVAAGEHLLSAEGATKPGVTDYWFNDGHGENDLVRRVTVERLVGLGLLESEEFGLGDRAHHYKITVAGFDALGIKVVDDKPPAEQEELGPEEAAAVAALNELMAELDRLMAGAPRLHIPVVRPPLVTPTGVDKHITAFIYGGPELGMLQAPPLADADEIRLLEQVRSKVPEFGHRQGMFESGILEVEDGGAILVMAAEGEDTYAAVFCQNGDEAMGLLMRYAEALGMELDACQYFPPEQGGEEQPA